MFNAPISSLVSERSRHRRHRYKVTPDAGLRGTTAVPTGAFAPFHRIVTTYSPQTASVLHLSQNLFCNLIMGYLCSMLLLATGAAAISLYRRPIGRSRADVENVNIIHKENP